MDNYEIKDRISRYLANEVCDNVTQVRNAYFAKHQKRIYEKRNKNEIDSKSKELETRVKCLNKIIQLFTMNLEFQDVRDEFQEIKDCLSEYSTFCDREIFYYDPMKLIFLNDKQVMEIVMCEFLNSYQIYYMIPNFKMGACRISETKSNTLLMMYWIGMINDRPEMSTQNRYKAYDKFNEKYPENNTIIFDANDNAANYLLNKIITDNYDESYKKIANMNDNPHILGFIYKKNETYDTIHYELKYNGFSTLKIGSSGISFNSFNNFGNFGFYHYFDVYYLKQTDGSTKRIRSNSKEANVCKNLVEMMDKVIG